MSSASSRVLAGIAFALFGLCTALIYLLIVETNQTDREAQLRRELQMKIERIERSQIDIETPQAHEPMVDAADLPREKYETLPPATAPPPSKIPPTAGTAVARELVNAEALVSVRQIYHPILDKLALSNQQQEDLLTLLAQERANATETADFASRPIDPNERLERLAAVMGYTKLEIFEDFENHLAEHMQAQQITTQLAQTGEPLSEHQRAKLTALLISERERDARPATNRRLKSIQDLERRLNAMNDHDRRVLESAAFFLSSEQMKHLGEQYQARAARRALALDIQRKRQVENSQQGIPLWYPPE